MDKIHKIRRENRENIFFSDFSESRLKIDEIAEAKIWYDKCL